jgi:hypothetical protein
LLSWRDRTTLRSRRRNNARPTRIGRPLSPWRTRGYAGEHDAATLERVLATDFVHPVATGDLLTKTQHIHYSTKYLPPAGLKQRFDNLTVRLYGDVGIVNGIVITSDEHAKDVDRTIFTDVFAYRDGRWQAINAQENRVEEKPPLK